MVVVRSDDGRYWTPNGNHRLAAMRHPRRPMAVAIVVPEAEVAHRILLLNTEKAHNLRERALEVARLAREPGASSTTGPSDDFEAEFEEPALLTLGFCYQENGRFAGGAYHPVLRRTDKFLGSALPRRSRSAEERAARVIELEEAVTEAIQGLKARGFESPTCGRSLSRASIPCGSSAEPKPSSTRRSTRCSPRRGDSTRER